MSRSSRHHHIGAAFLTLCLSQALWAQPPESNADNSPSPTAGKGVSNSANQAADRGLYQEVQYPNASRQGPPLIVIPGEVKSSNASFVQKFGPNNIADFAELELSKANFRVLERADLGPALDEIQLAYSLGDPESARKIMKKGKLKTTQWIVKFDILKAEQVAEARRGFSGQTAQALIGIFGRGGTRDTAAQTVAGSIDTKGSAGVWIIGMRYKILDANTTEQVAQGYAEDKLEVGAKSTTVAGLSSGNAGGLTLDTMVQRLVQKSVYDIDSKHK